MAGDQSEAFKSRDQIYKHGKTKRVYTVAIDKMPSRVKFNEITQLTKEQHL